MRTLGLPILMFVVLVAILSRFEVNQYSVGMYGTPKTESSFAGVDRPIRSDEWLVRLPWLLSQSIQDYGPNLRTSGIHDASIIYDLPVRGLEILLKPHLIPYLLLDIEQAVAAEWWLMFLGCGFAVYGLLLSLRIRPGLAAPLGALVAFNPGMHWWTVNSSFTVILYGCLGTTALMSSWRMTRLSHQIFLGLLGGWLLSCATVILYPPFQIPVLGILGLILILKLAESVNDSGWRSAGISVVCAVLVFLLLVGRFVFENRSGLSALANTVYPGSRRTSSGGESLSTILGAPFDVYASRMIAGSVNYTNQSENASSFLTAAPVLLFTCAGVLHGLKTRNARLQYLLLAWFSLLLAWMLLPLPRFVGALTLLERVPPERIRPVIILVSVLAFAIHIEFHNDRLKTSTRTALTGLFFFATVWAGSSYVVENVRIDLRSVWLWSISWVGALTICLVGWRRIGLWSLSLLSIAATLNINPIRTGLEPMYQNSIVRSVSEFDPEKNATWITFTGTAQIRGLLVSTGVRVDSAVSPFPDENFWLRLDPFKKYESQWNRYGHVHFVIGQGETQIANPQDDVITVSIDPCVNDFPIDADTLSIESDPTLFPCMRVLKKIEYQGSSWYVMKKTD